MSKWISGRELVKRLGITHLELFEMLRKGLQPHTQSGEPIGPPEIRYSPNFTFLECEFESDFESDEDFIVRTKKLAKIEEKVNGLKEGLSETSIRSWLDFRLPQTEKEAAEVVEQVLAALYNLEDVLKIVEQHDLERLGSQAKGFEDGKPENGPPVICFYKNGDYWKIGEKGKEKNLKHLKGFEFIQTLIRHQGKEFQVFDLYNLLTSPDAEKQIGIGHIPEGLEKSKLIKR